MEDSSVWREADTRARHLGLVSSVEESLSRYGESLEEGTVGASPGLAASLVETCGNQPGRGQEAFQGEPPTCCH